MTFQFTGHLLVEEINIVIFMCNLTVEKQQFSDGYWSAANVIARCI